MLGKLSRINHKIKTSFTLSSGLPACYSCIFPLVLSAMRQGYENASNAEY